MDIGRVRLSFWSKNRLSGWSQLSCRLVWSLDRSHMEYVWGLLQQVYQVRGTSCCSMNVTELKEKWYEYVRKWQNIITGINNLPNSSLLLLLVAMFIIMFTSEKWLHTCKRLRKLHKLEQSLSNEESSAFSRSSTSYQTKSTNVSYKMHKVQRLICYLINLYTDSNKLEP